MATNRLNPLEEWLTPLNLELLPNETLVAIKSSPLEGCLHAFIRSDIADSKEADFQLVKFKYDHQHKQFQRLEQSILVLRADQTHIDNAKIFAHQLSFTRRMETANNTHWPQVHLYSLNGELIYQSNDSDSRFLRSLHPTDTNQLVSLHCDRDDNQNEKECLKVWDIVSGQEAKIQTQQRQFYLQRNSNLQVMGLPNKKLFVNGQVIDTKDVPEHVPARKQQHHHHVPHFLCQTRNRVLTRSSPATVDLTLLNESKGEAKQTSTFLDSYYNQVVRAIPQCSGNIVMFDNKNNVTLHNRHLHSLFRTLAPTIKYLDLLPGNPDDCSGLLYSNRGTVYGSLIIFTTINTLKESFMLESTSIGLGLPTGILRMCCDYYLDEEALKQYTCTQEEAKETERAATRARENFPVLLSELKKELSDEKLFPATRYSVRFVCSKPYKYCSAIQEALKKLDEMKKATESIDKLADKLTAILSAVITALAESQRGADGLQNSKMLRLLHMSHHDNPSFHAAVKTLLHSNLQFLPSCIRFG